ncbi:hypothetical protein [Rhizobium sp. Rhizsp82]|uniref:hypothetical protein n=1 Tax=Rhizobium sp. Rhizsp82 TaxID=3243057 RepID=UPI0039B6ACC1
MARSEEEKLVFTLEAKVNAFEKALARQKKVVNDTSNVIEGRFKKLSNNISTSVSGAVERANNVLGKLGVGAIGITSLAAVAKEAVGAVLDMGKAARTAGVDFKTFQELTFAASQSRVEVDALTDGLKELQLRGDEFAKTGQGSAAEAFKRIGMNASSVAVALKDPAQMLETVIEKIKQLDRAAQLRVLDEMFGGQAAEQFVGFLDKGASKISDLRSEARSLGAVLDEEALKKAEELNREWDKMATLVGSRVKTAALGVAEVVAGMVTKLESFSKTLGDLGNSSVFTTFGNMLGVDMSKKYKLVPGQGIVEDTGGGPTTPKSSRSPTGGRLPSATDIMKGALIDQRINNAFDTSGGSYSPKDAGSTSKQASAYKQLTDNVNEHVKVLKAQYEAQAGLNPLVDDFGFAAEKAAMKQQLLAAAQESGVKVTPQLEDEIDKLATSYANASAAGEILQQSQDKIRERAEEMVELQKDVTRGIIDGFTSGAKAADIFADALKKVGDRLINDVLDSVFKVNGAAGGGGGFLSGLLSFFGGGQMGIAKSGGIGLYSSGGYTGPGGKNQAAGVVHKGEVVFSQDDVRRAGGVGAVEAMRRGLRGYAKGGPVSMPSLPSRASGAVAGPSVTYAPVIDARGADTAAVARLEQAMAKDRAEFRAKVVETVNWANKRRFTQ